MPGRSGDRETQAPVQSETLAPGKLGVVFVFGICLLSNLVDSIHQGCFAAVPHNGCSV